VHWTAAPCSPVRESDRSQSYAKKDTKNQVLGEAPNKDPRLCSGRVPNKDPRLCLGGVPTKDPRLCLGRVPNKDPRLCSGSVPREIRG